MWGAYSDMVDAEPDSDTGIIHMIGRSFHPRAWHIWAVFVFCGVFSQLSLGDATSDLGKALVHSGDYVYGYYPYGYRGRNSEGDIVFGVQATHYGLLVNASKARIEKSGAVTSKVDADTAARLGNDEAIDTLAKSPLTFQVKIGETIYDAVSGAPKPDAVVIQRLGKYLANVEIRDISLRGSKGEAAPGITGRLLLHCWPDHARATFQVESKETLKDVTLRASYHGAGDTALVMRNIAPGSAITHSGSDNYHADAPYALLSEGESVSHTVGLFPSTQTHHALADIRIRAEGIAPYAGELSVAYDPSAGWHQIALGNNPDIWTMERVRILIENPSHEPRTLPLAFSKRGGGFGITGMSPVLCDESGAPLGLPIQISKNWHVSPAWFDGITMLHLEPGAKHAFEFRMAYANWGGVPAVSHAQLALEGWGTHQLWDECAIGSFGESITYDPDVNLNRAMVDDIRPLMVWGMGDAPLKKWSWTHNVGGADFLVLEQDDQRKYLTRQKTVYASQGPVLSDVRYVGETPDGAIQSHVTTQSWRSDDFVRGLYTLRYKVVKPVAFSRLAFFQLGADRYNHNLFATISRGDLQGEKVSWAPAMGGKSYSRERAALEGVKPWLALTGSEKNKPPHIKEGDQGAWADRGFVLHHWNARLGGESAPTPHYGVFGTEDGGIPSALVELTPPPGIHALAPGDFVEAVVEMVIVPQRAEDYYGPNASLRAHLTQYPGDWRTVHREVQNTAIDVTARVGKVVSEWPIVIRARKGSKASFTIRGGGGYLPITITGVSRHAPFQLALKHGDTAQTVRQSELNDWWQCIYDPRTESYDLLFTVPMDPVDDLPQVRTFDFSLE